MKLLLAIQYWAGDCQRAHELACMLARIQADAGKAAGVGFMLASRHDAPVPDPAVLDPLSHAFEAVHGYQCPEGLRGYPGGCNSVWRYTVLEAKRLGYDYVLTFEADCSPLRRNWVERIIAAIEDAQAKYPNAAVFGAQQGRVTADQKPQCAPHINGNAVFRLSPRLVDVVTRYVPRADRPWDMQLYPAFCDRAGGVVDLREIRSDWRSTGFTEEQLHQMREQGVVFHHGCRDTSITRQVARRLGVAPEGEAASAELPVLPQKHVDPQGVSWDFQLPKDRSWALVATSSRGTKLHVPRTPAFDAWVASVNTPRVVGVLACAAPVVVLGGSYPSVMFGDTQKTAKVELSSRANGFRIRSVQG